MQINLLLHAAYSYLCISERRYIDRLRGGTCILPMPVERIILKTKDIQWLYNVVSWGCPTWVNRPFSTACPTLRRRRRIFLSEGLGNKFLANIRNTNAIIHVLRCFENDNITHVDGSIDPVRDKGIIDTELQLKDLETIENRLAKTQKQAVVGGDKQAKRAVEILLQYKTVLEQGLSARTVELEKEDRKLVADLNLLTDKPVLYVCNVDEKSAVTGNEHTRAVEAAIADERAEMLIVAAATEADIAELDEYEERQMFLEEIGLKESGVARLIKAAYKLLDLQTFFTTGADESRAWTFRRGMKAPQTAGIIHTDFERGFIRAEVIKYDDYVALGSEKACRDQGKIGVEGKEYVVQDGDIMHFLFNV